MVVKKGAVVIDTRLNTKKIDNDFKNLNKQTQSLINRYNRSVDSIRSQELAISKVKSQLDDLVNGNKTPASVKNLERELINAEKEVKKLQTEYDNIGNKLNPKNEELKIEMSLGELKDIKKIDSLKLEIANIENESLELADKLEQAKDKANALKENLNQIQMNSNSSKEVQELQNKLSIMNSKLSQTKEEANQTGNEINNIFEQQFSTSKIGTELQSLNDKFKNATKQISKFSTILLKKMSFKSIEKSISNVGKKIDKFKSKLLKLIGTVVVFSLLRNSLNKLKDSFLLLLKSNSNFSSSLNQIKANLMTAFAPIYNAVLPAINSLMNVLEKATGAIAVFISSLFGMKVSEATSEAEKLSNALNKVTQAGDKANGSLSNIDKLDVIGNSDTTNGMSQAPTIDYSGTIEASNRLLEILNKIKALINEGNWNGLATWISNAFTTGLKTLTNGIKNIPWSSIGVGLSDFLSGIKWSDVLVGIVDFFGEAVLGFQDLFLAIDWETTLSGFSTGLADAIKRISFYIDEVEWEKIGKTISTMFTSINWESLGTSVTDTVWSAILGVIKMILSMDWSEIGKKLSTTVHTWCTHIIEKFKTVDWEELGRAIAKAVWDFISNVNWGQLAIDILKLAAQGLMSGFGIIKGAFEFVWNKVLEFFGIGSDNSEGNKLGTNIVLGIIGGIGSMANGIYTKFGEIWEGIKRIFGKVGTFFKDTFKNAWEKVKEVFSTGGEIFTGIKDGILNGFKTIVNTIIRGINKVVKIPFDGINSTLTKIKNIDILGVKPFKGLVKTIGVPKIPELATGAVIPPRHRFAAILGDQKHGTNIEAPLETIKQANREVLQEFMGTLLGMNNNDREIVFKNLTIIAQFGNKDFSKIVVEAVRMAEKELGKQLFVS